MAGVMLNANTTSITAAINFFMAGGCDKFDFCYNVANICVFKINTNRTRNFFLCVPDFIQELSFTGTTHWGDDKLNGYA